MLDFLFQHHIARGIVPVADAFSGGVNTPVYNLKNYGGIAFIIITGAIQDSGISNLCKVQACSDTTPSTTVDMPFYRRSIQPSTSADTWATLVPTLNAATGYNFTLNNAVANAIHIAEVTAEMIEQAAPGYLRCRLSIAETADKTITATVLPILLRPRFSQASPLTALG